jgi:hypothetical protein
MAAGQVSIDGKTYTKRHQVIPQEVTVASNGQLIPFTLTLPGIAMFMLRGLTRDVLAANTPVTNRRFRFRLGNSDGGIWYSVGGTTGTSDRVIDSLMFGTGQFPYILDPFILYSVSASIKMEIEDLSQSTPYTIFFAFQGCWLLPTS